MKCFEWRVIESRSKASSARHLPITQGRWGIARDRLSQTELSGAEEIENRSNELNAYGFAHHSLRRERALRSPSAVNRRVVGSSPT